MVYKLVANVSWSALRVVFIIIGNQQLRSGTKTPSRGRERCPFKHSTVCACTFKLATTYAWIPAQRICMKVFFGSDFNGALDHVKGKHIAKAMEQTRSPERSGLRWWFLGESACSCARWWLIARPAGWLWPLRPAFPSSLSVLELMECLGSRTGRSHVPQTPHYLCHVWLIYLRDEGLYSCFFPHNESE